MNVRGLIRYGAEILLLAALYFLAGKLGLMLASVHASATAVWPPTGIALAVLLTGGMRLWPGIALGAFLTNITTLGTTATCMGIAAGNTLEAVVGAYLLMRFARGARAFDRPQDFFKFVGLAAVGSSMVSATIGVVSLSTGGFAAWTDFGRIWLTWWLGDLSGDLMFAPLLLLLRRNAGVEWTWKRWAELGAIFGVIILVGLVTFGGLLFSSARNYPLTFLCLPPLIWMALRFGQREAALAVFVLGMLAIGGTMKGQGPFVRPSQNESLLLIQLFMGVNAIVALTLGAVVLERRQATAALQKSEERLRQIAETVHEIFYMSDVEQGKILYISPAYETIWGCTCESLYHDPHSFLKPILPQYRQRMEDALEKQRRGEMTDIEYEIQRGDKTRWIRDRSFPLRDGTGRVYRVTGIAEDITEHKRVLVALQRSEAQARAMLESALDCVITIDSKGRVLEFNPASERTFGYAREEVLGREMSELIIPPGLREWHRAGFERYLATGEARVLGRRIEMTACRSDGYEFPVELAITRVRGEGPPVFTGFLRDITERKKAQEALGDSESRFRSIWENSADGMRLTDAEGNIIAVNGAFCELAGISAGEGIGKPFTFCYGEAEKPDEMLARYKKRFGDRTVRTRVETRVVFRSKKIADLEITNSFIELENQGPLLLGIFREVTERKRSEVRSLAFSTLAHELSAAPAARDAARIIVRVASTLLGWDACFLHLYFADQELFTPVLAIDTIEGEKVDAYMEGRVLDPSPSMRRVVREGAQLILRQNSADTADDLIPMGDRDRRSASLMFVPIHNGRQAVGILSIQSYSPQAYDRADLETLQALADHCAGALERMRAQEAMLQAEEKYRTIFENATEGLFQSTPTGRFLNVNPALATMLGYAMPREFLRSVTNVRRQICVVPEAHDLLHRQLIEQGFVRDFEIQLYRKDGSIRWVNFNARVVRSADGQLVTEGSSQDITERKRAEKRSAAFSKLGERLSAAVTQREAAQIIGDVSKELFGWDAYTVDAYDSERDEIISILNIDFINGQQMDVPPATPVARPSERARRILERGAELILRDAPADAGAFDDTWRPSASVMLASIRHGGRVTGILCIQSHAQQAYTADDLNALQALADHCGGALERIRVQETLAKFAAIVEHSDDAIISKTLEGVITSWNPAAEKIFGYSAAEALGCGISILIPPDQLNEEEALIRRIEQGESPDHYETVRLRKDGKRIDVSVTVSPIKDSSGRVIGASKIARDITDKKRAREALREANARVFRILNSITDGFIAFDAEWRITYFNKAADDLFLGSHRSSRKILGRCLWEEFPELLGTKVEEEYRRSLAERVPVVFEHFADTFDRWFDIRAYPSGDGLAIYFRDITERKRAEVEIRNSLAEKEVMLKEINHRVKNNLQVISSLFHLQAANVLDATARGILKESENRVKSMALIHENLYQSQNLSQINFEEYVWKLTADLSRSFGVDGEVIKLKVSIPRILLGITTAIPCGLIINELVSNALKYAFPNGRKGEIGIDLVSNPDTMLCLSIRDDGVGLPAGLDFRKTTSLGMQLVVNLVRQLNGTIVLLNGPGTGFSLTFKP